MSLTISDVTRTGKYRVPNTIRRPMTVAYLCVTICYLNNAPCFNHTQSYTPWIFFTSKIGYRFLLIYSL